MKRSIKRLPKRTQEELAVLQEADIVESYECAYDYLVWKLCTGKICYLG